MIENKIWNEITEGESDKSYPYNYVLVAVQEDDKVRVHIGCYFRQYEIERDEDYGANWGDYHEGSDQYYAPKGWYQEATIDDEYANSYIHYPVVAWAKIPNYEELCRCLTPC